MSVTTSSLPSSWAEVPLSAIAVVNPRGSNTELPDETVVSFLPMRAVAEETGHFDLGESRPVSEVRKGYTQFQDGDILIAKITPCMENGKAAVVSGLRHGIGYGSTEFHVVRLLASEFDRRFYFHYIVQSGFRREARRHMTGSAGQLRVPSAYLAEVPVPVPPLPEQRRIVAKIEELFTRLDAGVAALQAVKQQIKRYRQAVLRDAFTGKLTEEWRSVRCRADGSLPDAWGTATYGDLTSLVTSGSRGWSSYYADGGSLFIRAQDIKHDRLNRQEAAHVRIPEGAEGSRTLVQQHDILITITGANVTKAALVSDPIGDAYVSQHVALTRPIDPRMSRYLHYWLVSPCNGRRLLLSLAYGAGKPGLNLTNLRELSIPIPPLAEQEQIVSEIDRHFSLADFAEKAVDESLAKADHLRQSILKQAFEGRLVPQDPNDEPAGKLLARIKAARYAASRSLKG